MKLDDDSSYLLDPTSTVAEKLSLSSFDIDLEQINTTRRQLRKKCWHGNGIHNSLIPSRLV